MKDIALAGFVMTAEEWAELDQSSRQQLVAAAQPRRDDGGRLTPAVSAAEGRRGSVDGWVVANIRAILDAPKQEEA